MRRSRTPTRQRRSEALSGRRSQRTSRVQIRCATSDVQPVWWEAPSPSPVSRRGLAALASRVQYRPTQGDKPGDLIACQPATSYTTALWLDVRVQRASAGLSALSWLFVAFPRRLGRRPTRNAVTMRFRIRIRAATVVVAGSVDYVVLGQVEDHARSITLQTRRLAHSSWSLSGWMCRNTHPSARPRALAPPTTTCHQEALQVIQASKPLPVHQPMPRRDRGGRR